MLTDERRALRAPHEDEPRPLPLLSTAAEFNLRDLSKILRRRRTLLLLTTGFALLLGLAYALVTPRLYRAEARLQILRQDAAASFADPAQASATAAADALDFNLAVQTQVNVLESRNLALRVVRELGLVNTRDYQLPGSSARVLAENKKPLDDSPRHLDFVVSRFHKRLTVNAVSGSRLLSVSFLDRDPSRAAQVVNQLIADFIEYNYDVRQAGSTQANTVLRAELQAMKAKVDESQANVAKLQQRSGIYGVDEANNVTNAKLEQLNTQLTAAQANLAVKKSIYALALTRSPEVLAGMLGAQATGANTTNAPLQLLRQQQSEAAANYAELNARYGSQYPKVLQAGQRLHSIQASVDAEIDRLVGQATAEYKVAQETERFALRSLQAQETVASQMNHDATIYTSAKHEADASRDLYEQLQRRLKEAGVLASLHSTNLSILDPAILPDKPAQPLILLYLLIAGGAGLVLGIIAAFSIDAMDSTVRDPQKVEETLGLPVLALIPPVHLSLPKAALQSLQRSHLGSSWQYQTTAKAPRSRVAESFRALRTAVLSALPQGSKLVLAITSTSESEGKSFVTLNLAIVLAQSGRSVVVVDGDLRKRTLTYALNLEGSEGLDEAIEGNQWREAVVTCKMADVPGLFILPAGQQGHYPADVLGSQALRQLLARLRESFDIVLIDTPSVLDVTDTVSLADSVDALLIVAKCGKTAMHSLNRTLTTLRRARARVLGVVLNGIDFNSADYYYYWGKQSAGYAPNGAQVLLPALKAVPGRGAIALLALCLLTAAGFAQSPVTVAPGSHSQADQQGSETAQQTVIGAGDLLGISVFDAPELTQDVRVNGDGMVHLSLLGDVHAAGIQANQLANQIEKQLQEQKLFSKPQVSVSIKEFTTQSVTVEGEVKRPGLYPLYASRSLVDVLALADGLTAAADTHITIRTHGSELLQHVVLKQDNASQVAESDVRVHPGDTVIVPRAGLAYVLGNVERPGGYIMRDNGSMSVLQAISEAQGTTRNASLKHVILLSKEDGVLKTYPIQLKAMMRGQQPDQALHAGDILFVPASGLKTFASNTEGIAASISGAALYSVK